MGGSLGKSRLGEMAGRYFSRAGGGTHGSGGRFGAVGRGVHGTQWGGRFLCN